ncbi:MAG: 3-deoxy-manno-octulosonate cytidylyltransferase [Gemmataceae bacterium]
MKTAIVIPARYESSRLPGKPLLRETGKYLIQHTYEQACQSAADFVVVATDNPEIERAVRGFGGDVVMTRPDHQNGTDRVGEVAQNLSADIIINLQGDEPLIDPDHLNKVGQLLSGSPGDAVATLAIPIENRRDWEDPNCVKVVVDECGRALYISRTPIPYPRDSSPFFGPSSPYLCHLGLYAYRRDFLLELVKSPVSALEQIEKLEQLRVLSLGRSIRVVTVDEVYSGVDTPEDYARFVKTYQRLHASRAA